MARNSFLRTIDDEVLYHQLQSLVATMPSFDNLSDDGRRWLGRLSALVKETGNIGDTVAVSNHTSHLGQQSMRQHAATEIKNILFRALAFAELSAPSAAQGAFIAAGNQFDALAAVSKILAEARNGILFVDPYMDASILTDFAALAPESITIRLLADESAFKPTLPSAVQKWISQYRNLRPLEARVAPARSLHDRSIQIDGQHAWIATQSFRDLAVRSPASLSRLGGEAGLMKIGAYEAIWKSTKSIS